MNLQPDECVQFYRIWWSLLSYVNKQIKLFNDFPSQLENNNIKQQDAAVIRNALWASDRLLQDFIDSNPNYSYPMTRGLLWNKQPMFGLTR
ncbi:MAG: hypothetical protein WCP96_12190 [Methylococcaceae bacterium]